LTTFSEGGEVMDGNGRSYALPATTDPAIRAQLDDIAARWPIFQSALQPPVNSVVLQTELAALLGQLDEAVSVYEALARAKMNRLRGVQVAFLAAAFLLLGWGYRTVHHQLLRPLAVLGAAAQEIGAGNLAAPVPGLPGCELGQLGQTMETMRGEIAAHQQSLEQQVAQRIQELTAAFEFSQEIVRELEPAHLLQAVANHTRDLMRGDAAALCVLDGDGRIRRTRYGMATIPTCVPPNCPAPMLTIRVPPLPVNVNVAFGACTISWANVQPLFCISVL
jgi:nitrate/nitrite-specific signal transduction histidine kinase